MKCPHCNKETFTRKPPAEFSDKGRARWKTAEKDQFLAHLKKKHRRG